MVYADFRGAFHSAVTGDGARQAQLWNLEHETRVPQRRGQFKRLLGSEYGKSVGAGKSPQEAALGAMDDAIQATWPVDSKWLGQLALPAGTPAPAQVETHESATCIARYHTDAPFDETDPARTVKLLHPLKTDPATGKPRRRFIWITFEAEGRRPDREDPTAVKRELGLDHFMEGDYVYRFAFAVGASQPCYVPTCLDAGLNPPWSPPPAGHGEPWGLTRDLTTGEPRWPELLVEVQDYDGTQPTGELVSPPGPEAMAIGHLDIDCMIGR